VTGILMLTIGLMAGCEGVLIGPDPAEELTDPMQQLIDEASSGGNSKFCNKRCSTSGACDKYCQGHRPCKKMCNMLCDTVCASGGADGGALPPDAGVGQDAGGQNADSGVKPDSKVAPKPDSKVAPKPDSKAAPKPDSKAAPKPDSGVPPPPPPPSGGTVWYVRAGGGTASQCTGKVNADYPGSGVGKPCAFKHPFYALSPTGTRRMKGGDTLLIGAGKYRMGHGAPGAEGCGASFSWDCFAAAIPAGTATKPTRVLGVGWNSGCKSAPQLYGVERAKRVLDLSGSSHVQLQCLEITDHSSCVEHHTGGLACKRGSSPFGSWAAIGIRATDATNVLLRHVDVHGMAAGGIHAGRLKDWTLEDVKIVGNGWVGWDGDLADGKGSSNSGKMTFRRVEISWNGCGETYPGRKPTGCWGQSAGGYGDGLGTAETGGDWLLEDCRVMHNTSDGIDLLYRSKGGTITVRRLRAEGNAGNQLKVSGNAVVENSILVGNCAYFSGKSFTHKVDHCRALGNTLSVSFTTGAKVSVVNNTIYGQGDVLLMAGHRGSTPCNGSESLVAINNIFLGDTEYHAPGEKAALFYAEQCAGLKLQESYGVIHNVKGGCPFGSNDICADPKLGPLSGDNYGMMPALGSKAIDTGKAVGGLVPGIDYLKLKRPQGAGVERGACEVKP